MERKLIERKKTDDGQGYISLYQLYDDGSQYATWRSNIGSPMDTYFGHYFNSISAAVRDYEKRND